MKTKKKRVDPVVRSVQKIERILLEGPVNLVDLEKEDLMRLGWKIEMDYCRIDGVNKLLIVNKTTVGVST